MEAFLIKRSVEGRVVRITATNREIAGADLEKLLQRMIAHQKFLHTVERRGHPREIVEALLSAGADRDYFGDKDKLEGVAEKLSMPTRTVTVQRDEEHNRYQLQIEDRSSGYPRQHTIGVDFVTAGEYRTLLANHRDIPTLEGDIVVSTVTEQADEVDEPIAAADATGIGGGQVDPATKLAAEPKDARPKVKAKTPDVTLHTL